MRWLLIIFSVFLALYLLYPFETMTIINSHLGNNFTTSEQKIALSNNNNFISSHYDNISNKLYKSLKGNCYKQINPIPTIKASELTKEKFIKLSQNFTRPVVIKGFFKNTKAVERWNLEYLSELCGNLKFPAITTTKPNTYVLSAEDNPNYEYLTMKDITSKIYNQEKVYLNNVGRIFGYVPKLIEDMELERVEKYTGENIKDRWVTQMFVGGKGTGTTLHCAFIGNFFYNVKGQKKWYLIDPIYTKYLKPSLSPTGMFVVSKVNILTAKDKDPINCIPRYEVILEEGDMLYNAPWWWHAIINLSDYTIACANRYVNLKAGIKNNPTFMTTLFSHPISSYNDIAYIGMSKSDANIKFDKGLLRDILRKKEKV